MPVGKLYKKFVLVGKRKCMHSCCLYIAEKCQGQVLFCLCLTPGVHEGCLLQTPLSNCSYIFFSSEALTIPVAEGFLGTILSYSQGPLWSFSNWDGCL